MKTIPKRGTAYFPGGLATYRYDSATPELVLRKRETPVTHTPASRLATKGH